MSSEVLAEEEEDVEGSLKKELLNWAPKAIKEKVGGVSSKKPKHSSLCYNISHFKEFIHGPKHSGPLHRGAPSLVSPFTLEVPAYHRHTKLSFNQKKKKVGNSNSGR